jgi:RNA recognition motif-containing protein
MDRVDPSKSRGFGFVTFTTEDAMVAAAASLNGTELDGRRITVRLEGEHAAGGGGGAGGGAGRRPKHEAFVGGLAWSTDGDSLRAAFARFGDVVDAKVRGSRRPPFHPAHQGSQLCCRVS